MTVRDSTCNNTQNWVANIFIVINITLTIIHNDSKESLTTLKTKYVPCAAPPDEKRNDYYVSDWKGAQTSSEQG